MPFADWNDEMRDELVRVTRERDESRAQLEAARERTRRLEAYVRSRGLCGGCNGGGLLVRAVGPETICTNCDGSGLSKGARAALADTDAEKKGEGR